MLKFLDMDKFSRGLTPVSTPDLFSRPNEFHPDGLYSERIFGNLESPERTDTYSYIDLYTKIIHPSALKIILQLNRKIDLFLSASETFNIDTKGNLILDPDGFTGLSKFIEIFPRIKFRGETATREKFINLLKQSYDDGILFIDKIPVIPPNFRPAYQDEDKINDVYQSVLRKAIQVRSSGRSGVLFDLLSYGLQLAVNEHDKYVRTKVEKKNGLIRNQMLGKRIDFSGRAVITPGPDLKINEVGVPFRIAVNLFEPFVIHRLLYSGKVNKNELETEIKKYTKIDLSVDSVRKVIKSIKAGDKLPPKLYKIFWDATEVAMKDRIVICKRDPVLHAESVRGFYPKLRDGDTLQICALQVGGFNADFDGDQMAIYTPLTDDAQEEVKNRMMGLESSESSDSLVFSLSKEMYVGLYIMTKDKGYSRSPISVTEKDLEKATDPYIPVRYRGHNTTMGKAIVNSALPANFPFVEGVVDKKVINKVITQMVKKYDQKTVNESVSKLSHIGFKFGTIMAPNISLDDVDVSDEINDLKEKLKDADTETADAIIKEMAVIIEKHLEGTGLYDLIKSGAGKGWTQPIQILGAKGVVTDTQGNILEPVKSSFADGLTTKEFFRVSPGARKGLADRVLNTATTGYMSRKLSYVLNPVEADLYKKDCGTDRTLTLKLDNDLIRRLTGRNIIEKGKVIKFDPNKNTAGSVIHLRTPIYCTSPKVCHTCYGDLLSRHRTPFIGILAAQILGEVNTQAIMRCSDGLVHYNNKLIPFIDLFNIITGECDKNDIETKYFEDYIKGKDGLVKTISIQKHLPNDKMLFISTESGHSLICQSNHPLLIKKNPIHIKYENKDCRLIGDNEYTEYKSTRKLFETDQELEEIIANNLNINDAMWIDNFDIINNNESIVPELTGYMCGIYCAEGNKIWSDRKTKGDFITQLTNGPIKEKMIKESEFNYEKIKTTEKGIWLWDNDQKINKIVLGDYAWTKRLISDFINYDKKWLNDFIAGWIDGDGTVFTNSSTCCRIYTTSYYLAQQLKMICLKLGYKCNICCTPPNEKYKRLRIQFQCDIRFIEKPSIKSVKLINHNQMVLSTVKINKVIKGFDKITIVKEIDWKYPVYDIKTNTGEFMLSCVQNHNSFHTGGVVKVKKKDILADVISNDPLIPFGKEGLSKYLYQSENILTIKKDCVLTIDLADYNLDDTISFNREDNTIWVKNLISKIDCGELEFNIILDYPVILHIQNMERIGSQFIKLKYSANNPILEVSMEVEDIKKQVGFVERLMSGKEIFKDVDHFLLKLYRAFRDVSGMDLIHLEILISNVLRNKSDLSKPARLGSWNPVLINMKDIVFRSGFVQGLAFENIGKSINTGLISDVYDEPSILERVLTGTIVEEKKK